MQAFVTGSTAYGIRHKDSDIDVVVLVSPEDAKVLAGLADNSKSLNPDYGFAECSLRFGKLNLIVTTKQMDYDVWLKGTTALKAVKPIPRQFAVNMFELLKEQALEQSRVNKQRGSNQNTKLTDVMLSNVAFKLPEMNPQGYSISWQEVS